MGQVNAGFIQVLCLGRAPRTKETLPDFLKWRRVTRPPLVFHGLTGSQRTPGFWGVTVGVAEAAIAHASTVGSQGDPSNLQRFRAYHPPTFTGGGDPMVTNNWFMQLEKVLEAMEITFNATRIRLAAFQLENEAQIWWKWAKTSRDLRRAFVREFSPRI